LVAQQNVPTHPLQAKMDLEKSKTLGDKGAVLLFGGLLAMYIGAGAASLGMMSKSEPAAYTGVVVFGVGTLSTLASVPVFIIAGSQSRKARKLLVGFRMEQALYPRAGSIDRSVIPALSMKFPIR
jgi:hypothetical protein